MVNIPIKYPFCQHLLGIIIEKGLDLKYFMGYDGDMMGLIFRKPFNSRLLAILGCGCALSACSGTDTADLAGSPDAQRAKIEEMYEGYRDEFEDIREVRPADIAEAYGTGDIILVDVRTAEEQAVSMIPGAITKEAFEKDRESYTDMHVVVHCTIGYRSGVYVQELGEQGIEAENLAGSLLLWAHEGLPLEDSEGNSTTRVHVYGKQWDFLPEGYEGVW